MKNLLTACAVFIITGVSAQTKFGALIESKALGNINDHRMAVAKRLGISVVRAHLILTRPKEIPLLNSGFDVFLNINYGNSLQGTQQVPVPFPTDMDNYKQLLTNAIAGFNGKKPVVISIENEEDNFSYHSGTPQDYLTILKTAIPIVHAAGIKVTNAGITSQAIAYLVYNDLLQQGKGEEARTYKRSTQMPLEAPWVKRKGEFARQTLAAYKALDIDYVNFHWYGKSTDMSALQTTIEYLKRVTGKPVLTNEIGQYDSSPETVKAIMQLCRKEKMPYVIWYSATNRGPGKAVSLQNDDGSLKANGEAFKSAATEQQ